MPAHIKRYEREIEEELMAKDMAAVALWGGRTDIHPSVALLELVQWKAAEVAYWRGRVSELDEKSMTWGVTKREKGTEKGEHTDIKTFESRRHVLLQLLRDAEQDLATYAAASLRAGVDQQLVTIAKSHAVRMLDVIRTVVADPRLGVRVPDSTADQVIADAVRGAIVS